MALNPTYKHIEASLRVGAFTVGQWGQILLATVLALLFGVYVSPLPLTVTIFVSIVLAGSPLALSYGAMAQEWSAPEAIRAQWRWLRHPRRYLPGPSAAGAGYVVESPPARRENHARARADSSSAEAGGLSELLTSNTGEQELPEAGELVAVEALSRDGVLVTSEGALIRYLRVAAKNPLVMAEHERHQVGESFGALAARVAAGQSIQFYVEATPIQLSALLAHSDAEAGRASEALMAADEPQRAEALGRLHRAHSESLELHADAQAAMDVGYYVIVPYVPDQAAGPDWRALLPAGRKGLPVAPLERSLESHRRVMRESLYLTDAIRSDLEGLDLSTHLLSGPEVLDLLWRRCNPTSADRAPERGPGAREARLEVLGELDATSDAHDAAAAARRLRELIATSAHESPDQRYLRIDRDLEQVLFVATPPDATYFGWLLDAMQVGRPFALSVHVHALDRLRERGRHKARHRRLFGVNRGQEAPGAGG